MSKQPRVFSRLYVAMVRAGEASGALDLVLTQLADTLEKQVSLRHKVRSALTYPVVVLGLVIVISTAMLLFVVPMFKSLYSRLGGTLPAPTRMLLALSSGFKTFFPFVIVGVVIAVVLLRRWVKAPSGRVTFDALKLKIPIVGDLLHKSSIARFSRTLGVLLHTGVTILDALDITADTAGNAKIALVIRDARERVRGGETLSEILEESPLFPKIVTQMMAVGEETGALDELIAKVSDFYEAEVEAKVAALTSLLEPILIVTMGITVGGMVISLYLPMFNIIKLVNQQGN
jgi:type IV pilus assembly protein PilC